jgi:hypothetical protein
MVGGYDEGRKRRFYEGSRVRRQDGGGVRLRGARMVKVGDSKMEAAEVVEG